MPAVGIHPPHLVRRGVVESFASACVALRLVDDPSPFCYSAADARSSGGQHFWALRKIGSGPEDPSSMPGRLAAQRISLLPTIRDSKVEPCASW